jgi:tetratricopeptide (TPR) repeat protein
MKKFIVILILATSASAADLTESAQQAYQAQQWTTAADLYGKLTQSEPRNPLYWYRLGNASCHSGDLSKAESAFDEAAKLGFQSMYLSLGRAALYTLQGSQEKAIGVIETLADNGAPVASLIESDRVFDSLKSQPRFVKALDSMKEQAAPCKYTKKNPEYRQFDFWVGQWDVYGKGGALVGHSEVKLILGDCVINENWTDGTGGEGKSYNKYNAPLKRWEQYWVDQYGSTTHYVGNLEGSNMVYLADGFGPKGEPQKQRMTFFPLPGDKVRQFGETSTDGGKTWTTSYDLTYVRRQSAGK